LHRDLTPFNGLRVRTTSSSKLGDFASPRTQLNRRGVTADGIHTCQNVPNEIAWTGARWQQRDDSYQVALMPSCCCAVASPAPS